MWAGGIPPGQQQHGAEQTPVGVWVRLCRCEHIRIVAQTFGAFRPAAHAGRAVPNGPLGQRLSIAGWVVLPLVQPLYTTQNSLQTFDFYDRLLTSR